MLATDQMALCKNAQNDNLSLEQWWVVNSRACDYCLIGEFYAFKSFYLHAKKVKRVNGRYTPTISVNLLLDPVVFGLTVRDSVPFSTKYQFLVLFAQEWIHFHICLFMYHICVTKILCHPQAVKQAGTFILTLRNPYELFCFSLPSHWGK